MMAETWSGDDDNNNSDKKKDTFREDRNKYLIAKKDCEFIKYLKKIVLLSK